jgi:hypothetical protein
MIGRKEKDVGFNCKNYYIENDVQQLVTTKMGLCSLIRQDYLRL